MHSESGWGWFKLFTTHRIFVLFISNWIVGSKYSLIFDLNSKRSKITCSLCPIATRVTEMYIFTRKWICLISRLPTFFQRRKYFEEHPLYNVWLSPVLFWNLLYDLRSSWFYWLFALQDSVLATRLVFTTYIAIIISIVNIFIISPATWNSFVVFCNSPISWIRDCRILVGASLESMHNVPAASNSTKGIESTSAITPDLREELTGSNKGSLHIIHFAHSNSPVPRPCQLLIALQWMPHSHTIASSETWNVRHVQNGNQSFKRSRKLLFATMQWFKNKTHTPKMKQKKTT